MPGMVVKVALLAIGLVAVASADAQTLQTRPRREPREVEHPASQGPINKRDSIVAAPGAFNARPYWLALAECGGIYFKLNLLYTDAAVHARAVEPDPKANAEYTRKLTEAIRIATTYFDGAEHFLMTDRGIERTEAVLIYDGRSRAAGERLKTIDAALAAANVCPALYRSCQEAYPKACSETLGPTS